MLDGYPSHAVDQTVVDQCLSRPLIEGPGGVIRIKDVLAKLQAAGIRVFVAGGAPRDWMRGAKVKDVDLSINSEMEEAHRTLRAAFPEVDPVLIKIDSFGLLRWGQSTESSIDISILRSPEDLKGLPVAKTHFRPSGSLRANSRMGDFTINTFYYDCSRGQVVEPIEGSLEDLRQERLRLVSDPRKLAVDFRASLRIGQFVSRGFKPVPETWEHLERNADRDIQGMGEMLTGWVKEHMTQPEARERFRDCLSRYLREPRSRELLEHALKEGAQGAVSWSPTGPGGSNSSKAS